MVFSSNSNYALGSHLFGDKKALENISMRGIHDLVTL